MKLFKAILSPVAVMAFVPAALAQGASATAPSATPPAAAAPSAATPPAAAAPAAGGAFTDDDVQKYATALVAVNKVQTDTTVPDADKQAKMAAAVQSSGVDIQKFNAITQTMQTDKALQQRIQVAAANVPK
ncbi:DUF4168 domain-containing protein [Novosphingobium rosa]|uniref:DUF4168 domain-containing protein n=1 Tax=Novosphingobium rosa TaxID=76978 RepID=UPI00082A2794|nr:DUF4168 domain-containing protein [Novosphingobium rosa]